MIKKIKILIVQFTFIVLAIGMVFISSVSAATINCSVDCGTTCSASSVQTAITSSVTGDTVSVPAGSCTWTETVSITSSKKIVLSGAGATITRAGTAIDMTTSGSRVTGFGFVSATITVDGDGWRIDHNSFNFTSFIEAILVRGTRIGLHPTGLIDHNSIHNGRVLVALGAMLGERNDQNQIWAKPLNLGSTDNIVFVEDNTFTFNVFGNVIDANYGGGYVFRYNTLIDSGTSSNQGAYIEAHSVQGNNRASRKWEIYGNVINNTGESIYTPFRIRGGTGAIFYNSVIGTWSNDIIALDNVRSYDNVGDGGLCNGSSSWDGNEDATGYPCRDQIGRGGDATLWTHSPPGAYTQTLVPAYEWLNRTEANSEVPFVVIDASGDHIKSNRDFYNYNASFDGSSGMGAGTLGNIPGTCTTGTGYWATNQSTSDLTGMVGASPSTPISGTLYKCTATNTWTSYYTPYTYPHPLRGVTTSTATIGGSGTATIGGSGTVTIGN